MAESEALTSISASPSAETSEKGRSAGRHSAREVALQVLYAIDLGTHESDLEMENAGDPDSEVEEGALEDPTLRIAARTQAIFDRIAENFVVPSSATEFARELVMSVVARSQHLDELLGAHAKNWRVARMAAVDRNILRMASYELCDTETPVAVIIDEAVDLARRFGSDSSPAFVNGVLDAIAREVRVS